MFDIETKTFMLITTIIVVTIIISRGLIGLFKLLIGEKCSAVLIQYDLSSDNLGSRYKNGIYEVERKNGEKQTVNAITDKPLGSTETLRIKKNGKAFRITLMAFFNSVFYIFLGLFAIYTYYHQFMK